MKVLLAETAGFCKGVRRAMNMVLERSEKDSRGMFTDGPLIHNPQTIEMLRKRGVEVLGKEKEPGAGDTVVIRSHGVPPSRREELYASGAAICDATCPDVARIQGLIRRYVRQGYLAVIVGDKNHAEVVGLEGYAEGHGAVVSGPEEVAGLPEADKVCVVAQSTLYPETLQAVAAEVRGRWPEALVLDTICSSTYHRQEELQQLALTADAVVVVGGKNSANTQRLALISASLGTPTFHVETAAELDPEVLGRFRTVAVTAGASTPNWIILQAVDRLRAIEHRAASPLLRLAHRALRLTVRSDLLVASGAALLCYANAVMMGLQLGMSSYVMAFCYILSIHLLSHFTDRSKFERSIGQSTFRPPENYTFNLALMVSAALTGLSLAALQGLLSFFIMLSLLLLGVLYCLDNPMRLFKLGGRISYLRLIPASKDLFMSLGWSVLTVLFPLLMDNHDVYTPTFFLTFFYTFMIVLSRSLYFDLRDMQGDRIVGRETLPIIIGKRGTGLLLASLLTMQFAVLILGSLLGWLSSFGWLMLIVSAYICLYLFLFVRGRLQRAIPSAVSGDMQFVLAGGLACFYRLLIV